MTHTFNNSGTFTNSTLIQGSTLKTLTINIAALPVADDRKQALAAAVEEMRGMLLALPPAQAEPANLLIEDTKRLVDEGSKPAPDAGRLARFGRAVKEGAGDLLTAAPKLMDVAERVVGLVDKLNG